MGSQPLPEAPANLFAKDAELLDMLRRLRSVCVATWCWARRARAAEIDQAAQRQLDLLRQSRRLGRLRRDGGPGAPSAKARPMFRIDGPMVTDQEPERYRHWRPGSNCIVASSCLHTTLPGTWATAKFLKAATIGFVAPTRLAVRRDCETKPLARLTRRAS